MNYLLVYFCVIIYSSRVFSIKCHKADESVGKEFHYRKLEDYDECVYLAKQTDESHEEAAIQLNLLNEKISKTAQDKIPEIIVEKINSGELPFDEHLQENVNKLMPKMQSDIMVSVARQNGREFTKAIMGLEFEGVLNKNQY